MLFDNSIIIRVNLTTHLSRKSDGCHILILCSSTIYQILDFLGRLMICMYDYYLKYLNILNHLFISVLLFIICCVPLTGIFSVDPLLLFIYIFNYVISCFILIFVTGIFILLLSLLTTL